MENNNNNRDLGCLSGHKVDKPLAFGVHAATLKGMKPDKEGYFKAVYLIDGYEYESTAMTMQNKTGAIFFERLGTYYWHADLNKMWQHVADNKIPITVIKKTNGFLDILANQIESEAPSDFEIEVEDTTPVKGPRN